MTLHDAVSEPFGRVKKQREFLTFNKFSSTLPGVSSSSDVAKWVTMNQWNVHFSNIWPSQRKVKYLCNCTPLHSFVRVLNVGIFCGRIQRNMWIYVDVGLLIVQFLVFWWFCRILDHYHGIAIDEVNFGFHSRVLFAISCCFNFQLHSLPPNTQVESHFGWRSYWIFCHL